jgi:hypothetical protein
LTFDEWQTVLDLFRVPNRPIYVLGSFARHVTLYSQQIRALNLVAALSKTSVISEDTHIAVIGGGAAGLTAAVAAAALLKEKGRVLLLEELDGLLELQRNNRQRWIHPHIYDWPDPEFRGNDANLHFLNWTAGYAEQVATQIEDKFRIAQNAYGIDVRESVRQLHITPEDSGSILSWSDDLRGAQRRNFPLVILAVGFGLESQANYQDSYWTEDDIDGSFRKSDIQPRWLVSGYGDGAFTDLMRLCIRRFRHAEVVESFATAAGIAGVIDDLREIQRQPGATAEAISKSFESLSVSSLANVLKGKLRKHGPKVFLSGPHEYPYGPGASILNRLIVRVLAEIGAFEFIPGPTSKVRRRGSLIEVTFEKSKQKFNRVLLRHGPEPKLAKSFSGIWEACEDLRSTWKTIPMDQDRTRKRLWTPGFWDIGVSKPSQILDEGFIFAKSVERIGVRASGFRVYKEVRSDGASTLKYEIEGLEVLSGQLSGFEFYYASKCGQTGPPELDAGATRLNLVWVDANREVKSDTQKFDSEMSEARNRMRKLAGTLRFPQPLRPGDTAMSFGLSVTVLNCNALSSWEFDQLYDQQYQVHLNGESLTKPIEYLARIIWFPIENLKIRLTLPAGMGSPVPSYFIGPEPDAIPVQDVIRESVLQMYPPWDSNWQPRLAGWKSAEGLIQTGDFVSISPQTWELSVNRPRVGACYSVDWQLPISGGKGGRNGSEDSLVLEQEAFEFRAKLLAYRRLRESGEGKQHEIRRLLERFYAQVFSKYAENKGDERFTVSMLTYDIELRRLLLCDAVVNGEGPTPEMWEFWLPFGSGLAGTSFKKRDRQPLIYLAPSPGEIRNGPEAYMPFPNRERHMILVTLPVDNPRLTDITSEPPIEWSQQRIAVLDIGSNSPQTRLQNLTGADHAVLFQELFEWSMDFGRDLCRILAEST